MSTFSSLNRRAFLKSLAATGAVGSLSPAQLLANTGKKAPSWQNWSGNQSASPSQLVYATDENVVLDTVRNSTGTLRAFGGSHSFSGIVPTDDTLISLEPMAGMRGADANVFRYGGGTRLAMASAMAYEQGYSFTNEPDINLQSLAGAIATSTHGTGLGLQSLSGQVESLRLITPMANR